MGEQHEIQQAMDLHRLGKLREASEAYQRILDDDPANARIWAGLSQIWNSRLLFGRAVECLERAIEAAPEEFIFSYLVAAPLRRMGRYEDAARALSRAIKMRADHWESHLELLVVLDRMGREDEALAARAAFEAALPTDPAALEQLGDELSSNRKRAAIACFERASELDSENAGRWVKLATLQREVDTPEQAMQSYQRAIDLDPKANGAHAGLVSVCERLGMREDARWYAASALGQNPDDIELQLALARLDRQDADLTNAVARLRRLKANPRIDSKWTYASVCVELGLALDAGGDAEGAFANVAEGQSVLRQRRAAKRFPPGGLGAWIRHVRARTDELDVESWAETDPADNEQPEPVFVVGFPGTGIAAVESILKSAPGFRSSQGAQLLAETMREIRNVAKSEASYPDVLSELDSEGLKALRKSYFAASEPRLPDGEMTPQGRRILDAVEMNITRLGAIARVFPGAKIIHVVRDPRDCCLECVFSVHEPDPTTVHFFDLDTTTALYEQVMDLYLASRDRLGLELAEVRVEDLAADPEAIRRRVLDFVGAKHEGGKPEDHAKALPVSRWRRHAFRIEPFAGRLSRFVQEFGYGA